MLGTMHLDTTSNLYRKKSQPVGRAGSGSKQTGRPGAPGLTNGKANDTDTDTDVNNSSHVVSTLKPKRSKSGRILRGNWTFSKPKVLLLLLFIFYLFISFFLLAGLFLFITFSFMQVASLVY